MKKNAYGNVCSEVSSFLGFVRSLGAVIGAADREREARSEEEDAQTNESGDTGAGLPTHIGDDGQRNS